jgi:hypothetical protein
MDQLELYRRAVRSVILSHQDETAAKKGVLSEAIFDGEHDHYQLVNVGWQDETRIYGCILHIDILENKVWIQQNGTEFNIADELMEQGVERSDIVLGFQSPFKRQFTEFAVG